MNRYLIGSLAIILAATALVYGTTQPNSLDQYDNIILISTDPLRPDHLPCYGYDRDTAPAICNLTTHGFKFTNAYTEATWTLPAYASLLTSLYPRSHGTYGFNSSLNDSYTTLPEILEQHGFATAAFVGSHGDTSTVAPLHLNNKFGLDQGFDIYAENGRNYQNSITPALQWVEEHQKERFFMFLQSYDVHPPFFNPSHNDAFDPNYTGPIHNHSLSDLGRIKTAGNKTIFRTGNQTVDLSSEDIHHLEAMYDGAIKEADNHIERFLDGLRRMDVYNDTVILLYSAHGVSLGERGNYGKFNIDNSVLHIPLIIHVPGKDGGEVDALVQLTDFLPSILDMLGITTSKPIQGTSFTPLLNDRPAEREYAYSDGLPYPQQAVQNERWKLQKNGRERLLVDKHSSTMSNRPTTNTTISSRLASLLQQHVNQNIQLYSRLQSQPTANNR